MRHVCTGRGTHAGARLPLKFAARAEPVAPWRLQQRIWQAIRMKGVRAGAVFAVAQQHALRVASRSALVARHVVFVHDAELRCAVVHRRADRLVGGGRSRRFRGGRRKGRDLGCCGGLWRGWSLWRCWSLWRRGRPRLAVGRGPGLCWLRILRLGSLLGRFDRKDGGRGPPPAAKLREDAGPLVAVLEDTAVDAAGVIPQPRRLLPRRPAR